LPGVPTYRTHIQYVPQRPSLLPKTPRDFLDTLNTFRSRRKADKAVGLEDYHNVWDVARSWGIDDELWDRAWNTLSGGESQRIALAIAFGLNTAEVLLLDEPTSALDATTSELVEKTLVNGIHNPETNLKAIIWITHSEEQSQRVATRTIQLTPTKVVEEPVPDV
ncbi:P-loop containing nucleoside triphosphate hydrolase protein, partial [Stereum hirsutum FP-91666 SS1]|uniref:P-loop containing nucleoside triphosphate hydrolase protein n=1 Tax=Stereum hirsutum (strain FP-91666) TaxID=721885 RepID=UPI000440BB32